MNDFLEFVEKSLKINPYDENTWFLKGIILNENEKYVEALYAFEKATNLMPDNSEFWYRKD